MDIENSFIRFLGCNTSDNCQGNDRFLLGFAVGDEVVFQVNESSPLIRLEFKNDSGGVISQGFNITKPVSDGNFLVKFTIPNVDAGCYEFVLYSVASGLCAEDDICEVVDVCALTDNVSTLVGCFKFRVILDTCYTAVLRYSNESDFAGFVYENDLYYNQLRVPVLVDYFQPSIENETYRTSTGVYNLINSKAEFVYEMQVEAANSMFHRAMSIALLHSNLNINQKRWFLDGAYEIDWFTGVMGTKLATASARLKESPVDVLNPKYI